MKQNKTKINNKNYDKYTWETQKSSIFSLQVIMTSKPYISLYLFFLSFTIPCPTSAHIGSHTQNLCVNFTCFYFLHSLVSCRNQFINVHVEKPQKEGFEIPPN